MEQLIRFKDVAGWQYRIFNVPQPHCVFADCKRISYGWKIPKTNKQIFDPNTIKRCRNYITDCLTETHLLMLAVAEHQL